MRARPHRTLPGTLVLITAAGVATTLAAAAGAGPFAGLAAARTPAEAATPRPEPLRADRLFPAPTRPPTVEHVIEIVDPTMAPIVVQPTSAASGGAASIPAPPAPPAPARTAPPAPGASPTPHPCADDCDRPAPSGGPSPDPGDD